ncbi:NIPA protein [Phytophthora cinnamomi]|uniref:NIPA protein n=1 Tax=Phytophthora cinnamomi TaxID=4785 RepID=UPI003559C727|nr:NIPA protein [Phytophthora cinnamomi]
MAKLKTENELYAAKLPRLQAELLEETSQVDETQAQSLQVQIALTQLKARSHVLQNRNLALEAQNKKLNQQLREYQQQLHRKAAVLQQQTEKSTKLEADMNELKATHIQEKLNWKSRMTTAMQRIERDKTKLEAALKNHDRKELREAKDRAEKAVKKRQAAEASAAKLEAELKHCKHELASANEAAQHLLTEMRTLEALLRKAHRTEATLRNDLAACKTKLRTLQDEKKRLLARSAAMQPRRRRIEQQIPVELLLPLTDSSDDEAEAEDEENQEQQCCSHCLPSSKAFGPASPQCSECPQLKAQVLQLQQDLRRTRALHAAELNAQASVLDTVLLQLAVPQM